MTIVRETVAMPYTTRRAALGMIAASTGMSACAGAPRAAGAGSAGFGSGRFDIAVPGQVDPVRVWYHRPAATGPDSPIVMVMHGRGRNADVYRDGWVALAERDGLVVLAPEYSDAQFPTSRGYNLGWMAERDGTPRPRELWSFNVVDHAFDAAVMRFGSRRTRHGMFGHSAGAQFVHRYMLFMPADRVERAISANAGWYTLPVLDQPYPWGVGGTGVTEAEIAAWFAKPLVVLLGDADTDPAHRSLNTDAEVRPQGPHRFARGRNFFATGRREAERMGVPFRWTLQIVPGVAHEGQKMAIPAAELFRRG